MKKYIYKSILFIAVFILMDTVCGYFLQKNRPVDYKLHLDSKIEFFSEINTVDILIIGDSHIADALDPRTIETRTPFSAFNLGIYHSSPFENYYLTKEAIEKLDQKPRLIILGTNPVMFERSLSKGKYTSLVLPKLKSLDLVYNSNEGFDASFFFNFIREKYLFKSLLNKIIGRQYQPTRIIEDVYNGHSMFYNQIPNSQWSNFKTSKNSNFKNGQLEYFSKTIELAIENNIKVVIAHPTIWSEHLYVLNNSDSYKDFRNAINKLTKKYDLKVYYDYLNDINLYNSSDYPQNYFLNSQHLNYNGSLKYTNEFCDFLNNETIYNARTHNNVYTK